MGILDEIAKGGNARPIAAFLVGREQKLNRERQTVLDQRQKKNDDVLNEFRQVQIDTARSEPARLAAERAAEAEKRRNGIAQMSKAVAENPDIPGNIKSQIIGLFQSDQDKAIQEGLDILSGQLKPATSDSQPSPFTLAPGSKRFNPDGSVIADNPKTQGPEKPSAPEEKIARLEGIGLTKDQAIGVVDGAIKLETDPSGGVVRLTDISKALSGDPDIAATAVTELQIQPAGGEVPFPEIPASQSLFGQAGEATGAVNVVQNALSKVSGAVGGPVDDRTVAATQFFSAAENTVIRAFSLNPRFPVAEQNRIKENIAIGPRFFDSEELMKIRMRAIDTFLEQEQKMVEYFAAQPGASRDQRTSDQATANGIKQFRAQLRVPPEGDSGFKIIKREPANAQ